MNQDIQDVASSHLRKGGHGRHHKRGRNGNKFGLQSSTHRIASGLKSSNTSSKTRMYSDDRQNHLLMREMNQCERQLRGDIHQVVKRYYKE